MAAVPPFFVEAACMARSKRVLSEAGGNDRWRFNRCAIERVRGERAASDTGRAIVSGASAMLDMLRRSRRPPVARQSLARRRGGAGSSLLDGASTAAPSPRNDL